MRPEKQRDLATWVLPPNAEIRWKAEVAGVHVEHVERTRWPLTVVRERERERESNVYNMYTRTYVFVYTSEERGVVRPTSTTSDTRMNTREERCRDGRPQQGEEELVNAQQTRETGITASYPRRSIRPSWFVVSTRGEGRLVHEYGDVYDVCSRLACARACVCVCVHSR